MHLCGNSQKRVPTRPLSELQMGELKPQPFALAAFLVTAGAFLDSGWDIYKNSILSDLVYLFPWNTEFRRARKNTPISLGRNKDRRDLSIAYVNFKIAYMSQLFSVAKPNNDLAGKSIRCASHKKRPP